MVTLLTVLPSKEIITPQKVYDYCVEKGILYPEIVTAQSIWETGWYKCKECSLDKNNLFGFTTGGPYFRFNSWKKSIDYYKKWQDKHYDPSRDYYEFLDCIYKSTSNRCIRYASDPNYTTKIQGTVNTHAESWKK